MAALEYLTQNSLTAYPFKSRSGGSGANPNPIETGWFLDILFVSYDPALRSVFISQLTKPNSASIVITFTNRETLVALPAITIDGADFVDHLANVGRGFAGHTGANFAVKISLGAGLVDKSAFSQSYTAEEATLATAAFVLAQPGVRSLTVESYVGTVVDGSVEYASTVVHTYVAGEVPRIQTRYNSEFFLPAVNSGALTAARGLGYGLYDGCAEAGQELLSLNKVKPNDAGALFLTTGACYALNELTSQAATALSSELSTSGYYTFDAVNELDVTTLDVVSVGHSLVLQNFCKPKCPPENITAFAHYLNRVTDGAAELNEIVYRDVQTRGLATNSVSLLTVAPGDFCAPNSPFDICDDITCDNKFIKYFHEFRTLQIYYGPGDVLNYTILSVVNANSVVLDRPPRNTALPKLPFRVLDTGVISNMNCASVAYNLDASAFLRPYFKVKYTTSEAFNSAGAYVTYLAVSVALFNPSGNTVDLHIEFDNVVLAQQDNFKIRKEGDIHTDVDANVTLACREYAFVEAVYFIPCNTPGGNLDITVFDVTDTENAPVQLGATHSISNIVGADCETLSSGGADLFRVLRQNVSTFNESIIIDSTVTDVTLLSTLPAWLVFTPNYTTHTIALTANNSTPPTTSTRYVLYYRSTGTSAVATVSKLTIDYVAAPAITTPLASVYNTTTPLTLSKTVVYTTEDPALQISATNMIRLSNDFPGDVTGFTYSLTPTGSTSALPLGMTFSTTTGKLIGQLNNSVASGTVFQYVVSATNPAGNATNPQTIAVGAATAIVPTLDFDASTPGPTFAISNLERYTSDEPLFLLDVTGAPIYAYTLVGELPAGLELNTGTGLITGRVTETVAGGETIQITARNAYGDSDPLSVTINYTLYAAPTITDPTPGEQIQSFVGAVTTLGAPLFTVLATQALGGTNNYAVGLTDDTRNKFTSTTLPPGFVIDLYTGKVYGQLSSTELPTDPAITSYTRSYAMQLVVSNPVGSARVTIQIKFTSSGIPVILNVVGSSTRTVVRNREYTVEQPLIKLEPSSIPATFSATGLPEGLSCTPAGEIIGLVRSAFSGVNAPPIAGSYAVSLLVGNDVGTATPVTLPVIVPVCIVQPATDAVYDMELNAYTAGFSILTSGIKPGGTITLTSTTLPPGLSLIAGVIQGTPSQLGSTTVTVYASSTAGFDKVSFTITVAPAIYSVSGRVQDSFGVPLPGVTVATSAGNRTALTAADGTFTLLGVAPGEYNVSATSPGAAYLPSSIPIAVVDAPVDGLAFTSDGPYRLVTGTITNNGFGVFGIVVFSGPRRATTDSFGVYELFVPLVNADPVTPFSTTSLFTPTSYTLTDGANDIRDGVDFTVGAPRTSGPPVILSLVPQDRALLVNFRVPTDDPTTVYTYSTDGGLEYLSLLGPIIKSILSRDASLLVNFSVLVDAPTTRYDYSTDSGRTYNLTP